MTAEHTVLVVGHADRPDAAVLARRAEDWLVDKGCEVVAADVDRSTLGLTRARTWEPGRRVSLVLSIGGDGTVLRAVKAVGETETPILGVNVGLLGYLTAVEPPFMLEALSEFFAGRLAVESRFVLDVAVHTASGVAHHRGLNEASLEKLTAGHTVRLQMRIDGAPFTSYQADGMIVATPTGSTAYSLSARGPILSPLMKAIVVTPLSPHMLFDRSLVLAPSEVVEMEVTGGRAVGLAVDGEYLGALEPGDRIVCSEASHSAIFVKVHGERFHDVLKSKFGLADR